MTLSPLNGDGFGVAWYGERDDSTPCLFLSVTPAWNNGNLRHLSEKISSSLVFAHVRAATATFKVSEANCHPFCAEQFTWMHNGNIEEFQRIRKQLLMALPDAILARIDGTTDSEHAFALFLSLLPRGLEASYSPDELSACMRATIRQLVQWLRAANIDSASFMNFAVTDGSSVIVTRFADRGERASTLYISSGTRFECQDGDYRMIQADRRERVVIVASEPLTGESPDWMLVPLNHLVVVKPNRNVLLEPIEVDDKHSLV